MIEFMKKVNICAKFIQIVFKKQCTTEANISTMAGDRRSPIRNALAYLHCVQQQQQCATAWLDRITALKLHES